MTTEEYWDKVTKQKIGYKELDEFVPGEGGLQYFPVPAEEYTQWKKEKSKKDMEEYDKKQKLKENKQEVLELREELPRSNGHDKPEIIKIPVEDILNDTIEKKYPNIKKAATFYKVNPDHCDLKKKSTTRKRVSKKK